MKTNELISFGIPTFNRAHILDEALEYYLNNPYFSDYNFFISDNFSSDNTFDIVAKFLKKHENVKYFRQDLNIGADRNYLFLQEQCKTKYFLILGDSIRMKETEFLEIIDILRNNNLDLLIFNCFFDLRNSYGIYSVPNSDIIFHDCNEVLTCLGWEMTQVSCTIVNRDVFDMKHDLDSQYNSYFSFMIRYFLYLSKKDNIEVYWYSKYSQCESSQLKVNEWGSKGFVNVWIKCFANELFQLPCHTYCLESKLSTIKEFGKYRLFRTLNICNLIRRNCIDRNELLQNRSCMNLIFRYPWQYYYILTFFPNYLLGIMIVLLEIKFKIQFKMRRIFRH